MGTVRILSRHPSPFADRREAAFLLAAELDEYRSSNPVVLGIPRGGVVIAAIIAGRLEAEMDIVLARKIGAPQYPELAIGAISEDGRLFLDEDLAARFGVPRQFIDQERSRQLGEIARRTALYRGARPKVPLGGRYVITTDDGLATGATMQAALWAVRREQPARVVVAVPVGAQDTIRRLSASADEIVCLKAPSDFGAVGMFFRNFDQVSDEEVVKVLGQAGRGLSGQGAPSS